MYKAEFKEILTIIITIMLIIIITKDQLLLDEAVVSNYKRRKTNLSMA